MIDIVLCVLLFFTIQILIVGFMIREPLKEIADNITDIAYKLENINETLEQLERRGDWLNTDLEFISNHLDHIKCDMKLILGVADKKGAEENAEG